MQVIKRDGQREPCSFDKITARIGKLCTDLPIDPAALAQKVVSGVVPDIRTTEIDDFAAETSAYMATKHHAYGTLAGRIAVSNLQKNTNPLFSETMELVHKENSNLFSDGFMRAVRDNAEKLNAAIDPSRDFAFDHFAFQTLARSYLLKVGKRIAETPQFMWMRVAVGIHYHSTDDSKNETLDVAAAIETYDMLSKRIFTHATPTLFNAGLKRSQMSSCFLLQNQEDSVDGIYDTLKQCALISKTAGGIGLAIHNVRATNAPIMGTNGRSNGIVPMLRVFDATARYIDQGVS
jgi:ribonucleoside-diphosphate reductase alpha chain